MSDYDEIRYCSICRRSERDTGKLVDIPGGAHICPNCMQKMVDAASSIDYNEVMKLLQDGNLPMFPGMPGLFGAGNPMAGAGTDATKTDFAKTDPLKTDAAQPLPGEKTKPAAGEAADENRETGSSRQKAEENKETGSGRQKAEEESDEPDTTQKSDEKEEHSGSGRKPTVSFINLGDIFGGFGQGPQQQSVKKKKKKTIKPVFTADSIPAPHLLKAELDKYVIGQEHAKKVISVAAYNHYKRVETGTMDEILIEKSNILLIGPTGSGKTYLVKTLAQLLDVPLAITDATSLTEAGYIGDDVESCISKLLAAADNDVDKAEHGIVFIDEIDKLAKKKNQHSRDVSGEAVQQGLLKLLEGAEIEVPIGAGSKNAMVPTTTVDTKNILFICGGAFPALDGIIKQRLTKQTSMGFSAELRDKYDNDKNILDKVTTEDLRTFGMIPEFLGRLPVICSLQDLNDEMLVKILKEPKNAILKQYQKLLLLDDVELDFDEDALEAIAQKAKERDTGARALRSIIEDFMLDIMYEVPKDRNIGKVIITKEYVEGKGGPRIEIRQDLGTHTAMIEQKPSAEIADHEEE